MITETIIQQIIDKVIQDFISKSEYIPSQQKNKSIEIISSQVLDILIGNCRSTRLGPRPLPSTLKIIGEKLKLKIKSELPINIPICFGCKKTWKLCQPGVDIAEYFTILQLLKLNRRIQDIYSPGINFTLYIGDSWYEYIYNDNIGIKEYHNGLEKLINLHSDLELKLISMYSFHKKYSTLYDRCDQNLELLKDYWNESSNINEKDWQYLKSYKNLLAVGWVGILPNLMRIYYLKKMDRYLPTASKSKRVVAILKYFSYGLMLSQNDLIKRQKINDCTLEISLMSPPPGIPMELRGDRLYLRSLPPEISSRGAPCWPVMGILKLDEYGSAYPSILSPRDWNQNNTIFIDKFDYSFDQKYDFKITIPIYKTLA